MPNFYTASATSVPQAKIHLALLKTNYPKLLKILATYIYTITFMHCERETR